MADSIDPLEAFARQLWAESQRVSSELHERAVAEAERHSQAGGQLHDLIYHGKATEPAAADEASSPPPD